MSIIKQAGIINTPDSSRQLLDVEPDNYLASKESTDKMLCFYGLCSCGKDHNVDEKEFACSFDCIPNAIGDFGNNHSKTFRKTKMPSKFQYCEHLLVDEINKYFSDDDFQEMFHQMLGSNTDTDDNPIYKYKISQASIYLEDILRSSSLMALLSNLDTKNQNEDNIQFSKVKETIFGILKNCAKYHYLAYRLQQKPTLEFIIGNFFYISYYLLTISIKKRTAYTKKIAIIIALKSHDQNIKADRKTVFKEAMHFLKTSPTTILCTQDDLKYTPLGSPFPLSYMKEQSILSTSYQLEIKNMIYQNSVLKKTSDKFNTQLQKNQRRSEKQLEQIAQLKKRSPIDDAMRAKIIQADEVFKNNKKLKSKNTKLIDDFSRLNAQYKQALSENVSQQANITQLQYQLKLFTEQTSVAEEDAKTLNTDIILFPKTIGDLLKNAEVLFGDRLSVSELSYENSAEEFSDNRLLEKTWNGLEALYQHMWSMAFTDEVYDDIKFQSVTGIVFAKTESSKTKNISKLAKLREVCHENKIYSALAHLKISNKINDSSRIYFDFDNDNKKIILGWIGAHLPVYTKI